MGSGNQRYRELKGEQLAIEEHQLSMIPIIQQQTEMQLKMREKAFEQEYEQTKKMNLLALQLQPEPILMPAETKPVVAKYSISIIAGLAALAYFLLR